MSQASPNKDSKGAIAVTKKNTAPPAGAEEPGLKRKVTYEANDPRLSFKGLNSSSGLLNEIEGGK